jgi:3-methyladenine DNA glycosylase AlkD
VKKAVNWALRGIGKRNETLRLAALDTARRVLAQDTPQARWIARDAIRELESRAPTSA